MKALMLPALTLALLACQGPAGPLDEGPDDDDVADDDDTVDQPLGLLDAHIHLMPGTEPDDLLELAQDAGLLGIAVLGMRDATPLQEEAPDYVRAFAFVGRDQDGEPRLDDGTVPRLEEMLDAGATGIGELSVRHFPTGTNPDGDDLDADHPVLMDVYTLTGDRQLPVNIHFDFRPGGMASFESALSAHPETTFVWAHSGDAQPEDVAALMAAHDNLWVDISCRNPIYPRWTSTGQSPELQRITEEDGTLQSGWRGLFEAFPERIVAGTDVGPEERVAQIDEVVAYTLDALDQLEPEIGHAIASENARRLLRLD